MFAQMLTCIKASISDEYAKRKILKSTPSTTTGHGSHTETGCSRYNCTTAKEEINSATMAAAQNRPQPLTAAKQQKRK